MNLPKTISFDEGYIENLYFYDLPALARQLNRQAGGTKYAKREFDNDGNLLNDEKYFGNLVLRNGHPFRILHDEGYVNLQDNGLPAELNFHIKDHLGNVRAVLSETADRQPYTVQASGYYPFGMLFQSEQMQTSLAANANPYLYNGKEIQDMPGKWYDYGARFYDAGLGRWFVVDAMAEKEISWTPYRAFFNNPIYYIDPTGLYESTHTDEDGNVIAVYNDGGLGVYKHEGKGEEAEKNVEENYSEENTSAGGEKKGETEFWDEFRAHDNETGEVLPSIQEGATIMFGESWDYAIDLKNREANKMDLSDVAVRSLPNKSFDIKTNTVFAPHGPATGKKLNGKYATARSAGNYLAGMNGATGTYGGKHISLGTYMRLAGFVHSGVNFDVPPYYGEIPYAGRRIVAGFNAGLKKRKND